MSDVSNLEIGASSDAWDTRKWLIQVDSFGKQMTARHELKSLLTNFLVRKNGLQFWYDLIDFSTTNKNPRCFAGTKNATGRPWSGNPRSLLAFGMKLPQWTTRWLGRLRCLFLGLAGGGCCWTTGRYQLRSNKYPLIICLWKMKSTPTKCSSKFQYCEK